MSPRRLHGPVGPGTSTGTGLGVAPHALHHGIHSPGTGQRTGAPLPPRGVAPPRRPADRRSGLETPAERPGEGRDGAAGTERDEAHEHEVAGRGRVVLGEARDLAAENPDVVEELAARVTEEAGGTLPYYE